MDAAVSFLMGRLRDLVVDHLLGILISGVGILFMQNAQLVVDQLIRIVIPAVGSLFMKTVRVAPGQLFGMLVSAKNQVSLVLHLEDEIEFLRKQLPDLKAVILRAEVKPETEEMRVVFKDFVKDADVILDEFDAVAAPRISLNRLADQPPTRFKILLKVRGYLPSSLGLCLLLFYVRTAIKIKGMFGGLEKLKTDLDRRQLVATAMECLDVMSEHTDELVELPKRLFCFVGRKKEKEQVIKELLSEPFSKPSLVLITGMGGIGKSTLVQYIVRQPDIVHFFEFIHWVRVSYELDPEAVMGNILGRTIDDVMEIRSKFEGKRFLIVLDDLRSGKLSRWNELWDSLNKGGEGSKVVITSPDMEIDKELGDISLKSHELGILSNEECLKIFESYAFPDGMPTSSSGSDQTSRLKEIVRQIKGVPSAARVLGSMLRNKTEENAWNNVLSRNDDIMSVLMRYLSLPSHLKQCMAVCMLLPTAHIIRKELVVWMWIACGYVQPKGNDKLESIGENYFNDLVKTSLIQEAHDYEGKWHLHDLIHDLAIKVTEAGYFIPNGIDAMVRVLIQCNSVSTDISENQLQYAKVLAFNRFQSIDAINFGSMTQLRYLDLSEVQNYTPPESICSIYNLQTLLLHDTVESFPLDMWKLPNLRHLVGGPYIRMVGIGNSTSLQTMSNFNLFVGKDIEELAHLNELRGKLTINHLYHVHSKQSALRSQLSNKMYIKELVLDWEHPTLRSDERQDGILEVLCPHGDLRVLEINGYMGGRPPSWMGTKHLSNLVKLTLSDLHHLKDLPPLGHHRHLEFLSIDNLRNVRCIETGFYGNEAVTFPALKQLNMPALEEWKEIAPHSTS